MAKLYQKKVENNELFLGLWQDRNVVELRLLTEAGEWYCTLAYISDAGLETAAAIDMNIAARAGIALDANGRLKVIGQEVKAERLQTHAYKAEAAQGDNTLSLGARSDEAVVFGIKSDLGFAVVVLPPNNLRDLRDRINRHLAYLEQEGLA